MDRGGGEVILGKGIIGVKVYRFEVVWYMWVSLNVFVCLEFCVRGEFWEI